MGGSTCGIKTVDLGCFIRVPNPIKMNDLGGKTPIFGKQRVPCPPFFPFALAKVTAIFMATPVANSGLPSRLLFSQYPHILHDAPSVGIMYPVSLYLPPSLKK